MSTLTLGPYGARTLRSTRTVDGESARSRGRGRRRRKVPVYSRSTEALGYTGPTDRQDRPVGRAMSEIREVLRASDDSTTTHRPSPQPAARRIRKGPSGSLSTTPLTGGAPSRATRRADFIPADPVLEQWTLRDPFPEAGTPRHWSEAVQTGLHIYFPPRR